MDTKTSDQHIEENDQPIEDDNAIIEEIESDKEIAESDKEIQSEADEGDQDSIEKRLEKSEKKAKENYDRMLRISAEFENYKKRAEKQMIDFRKFANESIIKEILPVVDNLERALLTTNENNSSPEALFKGLVDGVDMTLKELLKVLEKNNVAPIDAVGKIFDPSFHQAMQQQENEEHPPNTVLQEFQKGYLLNDRLIRPAMVIVSKTKPKEEPGEKDA